MGLICGFGVCFVGLLRGVAGGNFLLRRFWRVDIIYRDVALIDLRVGCDRISGFCWGWVNAIVVGGVMRFSLWLLGS